MFSIFYYLGYHFLYLVCPNYLITTELSNCLTNDLKKELKKNIGTLYDFSTSYYDYWRKSSINYLLYDKFFNQVKKYNFKNYDMKYNGFLVKHIIHIIIKYMIIDKYDFDPYSFKPLPLKVCYEIPQIDEIHLLEYKKKLFNINGYTINNKNPDNIEKTLLNMKVCNEIEDTIEKINFDNIFNILCNYYVTIIHKNKSNV